MPAAKGEQMARVKGLRDEIRAEGGVPKAYRIAKALGIGTAYVAATLGRLERKESGLNVYERNARAERFSNEVFSLSPFSDAVQEKRTLFPSTVVSAIDSPRLFVSGRNSPKLGDKIHKGDWKGRPLFSLTLEERATCPTSCHHFLSCYGSSMPMSRRHRADADLIPAIAQELGTLSTKYPRGFVVRLHQLGDFYSVEYVAAWRKYLKLFPALHAFGYTAWPRETPIGRAVDTLTREHWLRFAIRRSTRDEYGPRTAASVSAPTTKNDVIMCPAQSGKSDSCSHCGLCWSPAAKHRPIGFLTHGRPPFSRSPGSIE